MTAETIETSEATEAHWIVEVYDSAEVDGVIVIDLFHPGKVCMTCREAMGTTGPCLADNPGAPASPDEVQAMPSHVEVFEAARSAFGTAPTWQVANIANGDAEDAGDDETRQRLISARQLLAHAEVCRRVLEAAE